MIQEQLTTLLHNDRREARQMTVLIIGRVSGARGEFACVVKNVSNGGLKARFPVPPKVGERLTFNFRQVPQLNATVRWVSGSEAGVEFDDPLDLAALQETFCSTRVPRPPRFACHRRTRLMIDGSAHTAELFDVSLGGASLSLPATIPAMPGRAATLLLPTLAAPRAGTVRWDNGDRLGFQFARPVTIDVLAQMLAGPQPPY